METRVRGATPPYKLNEPTNRNFLSIVGFNFILNRCPKVSFYCNQANIPEIELGVAVQHSYLRDIPTPGEKLTFGDLNLSFMVDEDCENYLQIYPTEDAPFNERSDGTLIILNSDYNPACKIKFRDMFPVSLSGIPFSAIETEERYFTAQVSFKYTIFDMIDINGKKV